MVKTHADGSRPEQVLRTTPISARAPTDFRQLPSFRKRNSRCCQRRFAFRTRTCPFAPYTRAARARSVPCTTRKPTVGDKRTRNGGHVSTGSKSFVSDGVRIDYRCARGTHSSCVAFNVLTRPAPERLIYERRLREKQTKRVSPPSGAGLPSIWPRIQISVIENEIWPAAAHPRPPFTRPVNDRLFYTYTSGVPVGRRRVFGPSDGRPPPRHRPAHRKYRIISRRRRSHGA